MSRSDTSDDADTVDEVVGRYRGSTVRYDNANCPTGDCPYIHVTELPYERQLDEGDGAYHMRLRERFDVAKSHANVVEMAAIRAALQVDIGIPDDGLHIPCRDEKEWLVWAYIQAVPPDAWLVADRLVPEEDEDDWFQPPPYGGLFETLWGQLSLLFDVHSNLSSTEFIGPDGILYSRGSLLPGREYLHSGQNRSLVTLLSEISKELGVSPLASLESVHPDLRPVQYGFQITEPPLHPIGTLLFEYEAFRPAGRTDLGDNVRVAQAGPVINDGIRGPFGRPSGQPLRNIGAVPRGYGSIIVHNGRGGPFGQLYRDGLNKVLRDDGLSMQQFYALRRTNPGQFNAIRQRAQQSARMRIPGVQGDLRGATNWGVQAVQRQGGQPNYHVYEVVVRDVNVYVKPDGLKGANLRANGRATQATHVYESKRTAYQANTQQIQAQIALARLLGARFELIVEQRTVLSATIRELIQRNIITLTRIP